MTSYTLPFVDSADRVACSLRFAQLTKRSRVFSASDAAVKSLRS